MTMRRPLMAEAEFDRATGARHTWLLQLVAQCRALAHALANGGAATPAWDQLKVMVERLPTPRSDLEEFIGRCALVKTLLGERSLDGGPRHGRTLRRRVIDYCLGPLGDARQTDWASSAELIGLLRMLSPEPGPPIDDATLAAGVQRFIAEHYTAALTDAGIAAAVNSSAADALRAFRRTYGCSVRDAIADLRYAHARRLLASSDLKISAVAAEVGYRSPKDLYRLIKARTGLTPARLRQIELRR